MILSGYVFKFGSNVDTDVIIPARYLDTTDPHELARHTFESVDPEFVKKVQPGDIIVAEKNFGCGSSREHAPIALQTVGISCVIAQSFARIFFRNALNIGLPILECPQANEIRDRDALEVDTGSGVITNRTTGQRYQATAFPPFMQEIIAAGGLMPYVAKQVGLSPRG